MKKSPATIFGKANNESKCDQVWLDFGVVLNKTIGTNE